MRNFFGLAGDGGYRANAVNFDGSNDLLLRGAELTGNADGQVGILSVWLRFQGGDGVSQIIASTEDANPRFEAQKTITTNLVKVQATSSDGTVILNINAATAITAASGWNHFYCSWNLATPACWFFLNGVDDETQTTCNDATIDYTRGELSIGAEPGGNLKLDADVADLYFNVAASLDPNTEANIRLFIDPNSNPVDLGEQGQFPTGTAPIVFLSGKTSVWETNKGSGGGFTETGTITTSVTSPSD